MKKKIFIILGVIVILVIVVKAITNPRQGSNKHLWNANDYEKAASGVVLIDGVYALQFKLNNGETFYLSASALDKKSLTMEDFSPELTEDMLGVYSGTGFFIDENGKIATNRHIIDPLYMYKDKIPYIENAINTIFKEIEKDYETRAIVYTTEGKYSAAKYCREVSVAFSTGIRPGSFEATVKLVANLNGTFGEKYECTLIDIAKNNIDVGIIQLNGKKTPEKRHVFKLASNSKQKNYYHALTELTIIGFNNGHILDVDNGEVRAQITSGKLSQEQDNCIMYDINALGGASGSPVLNKYGEVVAIHHAGKANINLAMFGIIETDKGFNYGVKVSYLEELLKKDN